MAFLGGVCRMEDVEDRMNFEICCIGLFFDVRKDGN